MDEELDPETIRLLLPGVKRSIALMTPTPGTVPAVTEPVRFNVPERVWVPLPKFVPRLMVPPVVCVEAAGDWLVPPSHGELRLGGVSFRLAANTPCGAGELATGFLTAPRPRSGEAAPASKSKASKKILERRNRAQGQFRRSEKWGMLMACLVSAIWKPERTLACGSWAMQGKILQIPRFRGPTDKNAGRRDAWPLFAG